MMNKGKIKVVKRAAAATESAQPVVEVKRVSAKQGAREMAATVSGWVIDFQQRRRQETRQAVERFFPQTVSA